MAAKISVADEDSGFGMIETPFEAACVPIANPVENAIVFFLHAVREPVGSEHRNKGERDEERADEREGHGVGHGMKEFSGGAGERVDRKVSGDDDGDGIKNGAVNVAGGVQKDFVELVVLAVALAEFAIDVFDHDDGAVNDDSEIDGADGEKIGGFAGEMQKNEGEEQRERNGERGDDGGADADQEEDQNDQHENHAAKEIAFDGVGGDADQVAAVVIRTDADVARKHGLVDLFGFLLDAFEDVLGLLAAAHEDDAFDGVVVILCFVLKAEDAEARSVADFDVADVFDANGRAIVAGDDDFADVFGGFHAGRGRERSRTGRPANRNRRRCWSCWPASALTTCTTGMWKL